MAVEQLDAASFARIPYTYGYSGDYKNAWGLYDFGVVALDIGDTRRVCKLPPKVLVIGGELMGGILDSNATPTVDIDLGWMANGGGSETYTMAEGITFTNAAATANAAGFINSAPLNSAVIANLKAAGSVWRPIILPTGPLYFSRKTNVVLTAVATQATASSGMLFVKIQYLEL